MSTERVSRKLAAILAADVVGYSRHVRVDEESTLATLNSLRAEVIDPRIAQHGGRIFKLMGDGLLAEFASVVGAVRAASEIQLSLSGRNALAAPGQRLELRIGVNLGDVVVDGEDLQGDGVNMAARLEGLADPGDVCISSSVHEQLRDRSEFGFEDMGERKVKNIDRPVHVWRLSRDIDRAGDVGQAGDRPGAPAVLAERPSIAVLPFANMSGDPDQEYFADGMVDELTTGLARIRWLTVIARNSSFAYKGAFPDIRQVGRDLGARYVMEGSVRKAAGTVRITAQLVEAETGGHLWAEKFTGALNDVFDLQDQITAGVVAAIEPSVRQAEIERAKRKRPENLDAYDLYLRALEQSYIFTPAARTAGLSLLQAAIALDPGYVEAHGVAAYSFQQQYLWGGLVAADREAALRHAGFVANARTDDATALAFSALALSALDNRNDVALVMVQRALERNPSSALAHIVNGLIFMILGRPGDAVLHAERALRLSPFDPLRHIPECTLAVSCLVAGNDDEALVRARRSVEANPVFNPALVTLALCLERLHRTEEARAVVSEILRITPDTRIATLRERYLFSNSLDFERIVSELRRLGLPD